MLSAGWLIYVDWNRAKTQFANGVAKGCTQTCRAKCRQGSERAKRSAQCRGSPTRFGIPPRQARLGHALMPSMSPSWRSV